MFDATWGGHVTVEPVEDDSVIGSYTMISVTRYDTVADVLWANGFTFRVGDEGSRPFCEPSVIYLSFSRSTTDAVALQQLLDSIRAA